MSKLHGCKFQDIEIRCCGNCGSHQLRRDCTKQSVWGLHCAWANGPILRRPVMHSVIIWNVGLTDSMHIQSALLQMTWSHMHLTCSESWAVKCHRHLPDNVCILRPNGIRFNRRRLLVIQDRWTPDISNFALPWGVQLQRSEAPSPGKQKMWHIFLYLTCFARVLCFQTWSVMKCQDIARRIHLPSQCLPPSPLAAVASGWAQPLRQNRVVDGSKLK